MAQHHTNRPTSPLAHPQTDTAAPRLASERTGSTSSAASDGRRLLTITAAARELSYSSRYITELIRRGRLDAIGRRRGRRVVAASIDRYIAEEREREEAER